MRKTSSLTQEFLLKFFGHTRLKLGTHFKYKLNKKYPDTAVGQNFVGLEFKFQLYFEISGNSNKFN